MQYALLIYSKPGSHEDLPEAEQQTVYQEYMALVDHPSYVASNQLQPIENASTVRIDNGQTLVTDGPFADTKEVFGGYYVYDLDNLDDAIAIAAKVPAARLGGSVEIRPLVEGMSR